MSNSLFEAYAMTRRELIQLFSAAGSGAISTGSLGDVGFYLAGALRNLRRCEAL